jgi:hypothetical protein
MNCGQTVYLIPCPCLQCFSCIFVCSFHPAFLCAPFIQLDRYSGRSSLRSGSKATR